MPKRKSDFDLPKYDDLFTTQEERDEAKLDKIRDIPLELIDDFPDHPFHVRDDEDMQQLVDSIKSRGVLTPAVLREKEDGRYELVSGHRRKRACELAGVETMPVIVREVDRDTAIIMMVDSNLQRENILPSERAAAYKMKLDAIKRQGARRDLTSAQVVPKLTAREKVAEDAGANRMEVTRYVRLTELQPELQQMVDEKKIGITPAVELSYLKPDEQKRLIDAMDSEQATPSLSQAQRMKKLSQEGRLTDDTMLGIMMEQKRSENWCLSLPMEKIRKYFPKTFTPQRMEETIIKLLDSWMRKRLHDQERS
jgi:ParB family chromosome partitioning protein